MKEKIVKLFKPILVVLLALVVSCSDLDVDIKSSYTQFPDSEKAAEAVASNAFFGFRSGLGRYYNCVQTLSSDEAMCMSYNAADWYDNGGYSQLALHWWNESNGFIGYFSDLTSAITTCNKLIKDLGGDENVAFTATIRAARAYYLFVLMDSFGDTPILNRVLAADEAKLA